MRSTLNVGLAVAFAGFGASIATAQSSNATALDGRWDATLDNHGTIIPFRLDIAGSGPTLKGTFYNGFDAYDGTTSATYQNGKLTLNIEHYLTTINASLKDGQLDGDVAYQSRSANSSYGFHATRHVDATETAAGVPQISGSWVIPLPQASAKGEKAFRLIVQQRGAEVAASILRVDGDTGAYSGTYNDGKWRLSHFDGSRPGVIEIAAGKDGTLQVNQNPGRTKAVATQDGANASSYQTASVATNVTAPDPEVIDSRYTAGLIAYREDVSIARGLPQPENYDTHTTARDPNEKFAFNLPDVNGKLVSSDDPRFKDKVVLAIVTGTWCPNCHDEAQYLVQLDKKYRDQGLAIVALDFEEPEQQGGLEREKAFVKQYGVQYTYLIAGAPAEMWEKVPQAVNLNTWPATIFVGRDGTIKGIHSGFASPASGQFNDQLKAEFESKIQQLLAQRPAHTVAAITDVPAKSGE